MSILANVKLNIINIKDKVSLVKIQNDAKNRKCSMFSNNFSVMVSVWTTDEQPINPYVLIQNVSTILRRQEAPTFIELFISYVCFPCQVINCVYGRFTLHSELKSPKK